MTNKKTKGSIFFIGFGVRQTYVQILNLPLAHSVTSDKLLYLSLPQFLTN